MIIGITGASGFIGGQLLKKHVMNGDVVRIMTGTPTPDNNTYGAQVYTADLLCSNCKELEPFVDGVDILYHCAGEIVNKNIMHDLHVDGTQKLIQAANGRIGRWIQLSTVGVYGIPKEGIITEDYPLHPQGIYEKTKTQSDSLVLNAYAKGAFEAVIVRPANVFGPSMRNESLLQVINAVKCGLFFFIGNREAYVNYIHVDNVIAGLMLCATHKDANGNTYIISNTRKLKDFIETIAKYLNCRVPRYRIPEIFFRVIARLFGNFKNFPLTIGRINALTSQTVYSSDKIISELHYRDITTVEEGLRQMCEIYLMRK